MHIVRRTVEPLKSGETAVEGRILMNRFETKLWRAWLWLTEVWDEQVLYRIGWLRCRTLDQHNRSCRGLPGHIPTKHRDPRVNEIDQRLAEIAKERATAPMPDRTRAEWDDLNAERDERALRPGPSS